jgi:hypothetical protein
MTEHEVQVELIFGRFGRLLSGSKSAYLNKYPDHIVAFNGNLCTKKHGKIWFGDIDVTLDMDKLEKLADELKVPVYVLREMDARFENAGNPLLEKAIYIAGAQYGNV